MRTARLLALLAALAALAVAAGSAQLGDDRARPACTASCCAPTSRSQTSFSRTPSFAWNPVPGALSYEFQLSLSDTFRDNSIVYADPNAADAGRGAADHAAVDHRLPARALRARARDHARRRDAVERELRLRHGAAGAADAARRAIPACSAGRRSRARTATRSGSSTRTSSRSSTTNSLDEREFYTFHQTAAWTGTVRWRIRALRIDATGGADASTGFRRCTYGAWSPIYTRRTRRVTGGPITLVGTVSDVFSNGATNSPAHKLTPAFLWTGNQTIDGTGRRALPRLRLHRQAVPEPRVHERGHRQPGVRAAPARPALAAHDARRRRRRALRLPRATAPSPPATRTTTPTTRSRRPSPQPTRRRRRHRRPRRARRAHRVVVRRRSSSPHDLVDVRRRRRQRHRPVPRRPATGAPVDLWDTNWPSSGYYWTVVGVAATHAGAQSTTVGAAGAAKGATTLPVASGAGFNVGDPITIGGESATRDRRVGQHAHPRRRRCWLGHGAGEPVIRTAGNLSYHDLELPQDVCAAGRVMRFGKESEPSLVASGDLFASGLSSDGRLTSGAADDRVLRPAARLVDAGARRRGCTRCSGARRSTRSAPRSTPRPERRAR